MDTKESQFMLSDIRRRNGLSQARMAKALKVNQTTVSQYERGVTKPGAGPLIRLMRFANEAEAKIILGELCERYGINEALLAGPSEFLAQLDRENAGLDAEQTSIEAQKAALDEQDKALRRRESLLRFLVLSTLNCMFEGTMAAADGLLKCVRMADQVTRVDFANALERLGKSGYITIFRVSEVREKIGSNGYKSDLWIKPESDPNEIALVKILPRGFDLLNGAIPPDPEVSL